MEVHTKRFIFIAIVSKQSQFSKSGSWCRYSCLTVIVSNCSRGCKFSLVREGHFPILVRYVTTHGRNIKNTNTDFFFSKKYAVPSTKGQNTRLNPQTMKNVGRQPTEEIWCSCWFRRIIRYFIHKPLHLKLQFLKPFVANYS